MTAYTTKHHDVLLEAVENTDLGGIAMPRRWSRVPLVIDHKSYPCYHAPAAGAHSVIGLCTGFKSSPVLLQNTVKKLNRMGFDVVGIALPDVGKSCDFMDEYQQLVETFFFSKNSPLYEENPELPRVALTHSLGGLLFLGEMQDIGKSIMAETLLKGAIHVSPFLDLSGYSKKFNRVGSALFTLYSHFNRDKDTPVSTATKARINLEPPTNGQVQAFVAQGRRVIAQAETNLRHDIQPRLRQTFLLGALDGRACPRTTEYFADVVGGKVMILDAGHNPMTDEKCKGFELVANTALNYVNVDEDKAPMSAAQASLNIEPVSPYAALA